MNQLTSNNEKNEWRIDGADCKGGICGLCVEFSTGSTWRCSKALVYADGEVIGCFMMSNANERDIIKFEVERTCGVHDICIKVQEPVEIFDVTFIYGDKFEVTLSENYNTEFTDTQSTSWEAVDMLGRHIVSAEEVRPRRDDKKVGIFYWTWRDSHKDRRPVNLVQLLSKHPEAEFDMHHPAWGEDDNLQCHWNEPGLGYYLNSDPYVLRKHAVMLADADIDFIVFDCTNGDFLWKDGYEPLLREFQRARDDGIKAPQVAFMLNFAAMEQTEKMLRTLYQDIYRVGKYEDLWFKIGGKPLIMAYPESLPQKGVCPVDTKILDEIRNFFAFRPGQPLYFGGPFGPHKKDQWGWLEMAPQNKYCEREDGSCEMMTVGVAQNARDGRICTYFNDVGTYGRSYTKADGHARVSEESYKYGYNFEEQWKYALQADPDIIFITGWNEWQMGRWQENWILDPESTQIAFVDQYNREYSRDIEPDIDGYLDTYYLQMINYIRQFKGAKCRTLPSAEKSADDLRTLSAWDDVLPKYENTRGATNRDYDGYCGYHYINNSARNEIIRSRVARDKECICFLVECADAPKDYVGERGLVLYLDIDRNKNTGFEGYDFRIYCTDSGHAVIERCRGNSFEWQKIGDADAIVCDRHIILKASRKVLGMDGVLDFEFKWSDNLQNPNVMDFYYNGDVAPHGRFNYLYKE